MANKERLDPASRLHFFQIINKSVCCHSQGPGQGPCPGSEESSSRSSDHGFLSESIQSVICVPSCLQNLPKTTLPFIPFLFKFWIMNCSVSSKVSLKSVSSIKKWAKSGFLDECYLIPPGILPMVV